MRKIHLGGVWFDIFAPVIVHAATRSRFILFGWVRTEWVKEGSDTGMCNVDTAHLLAKPDLDVRCSLRLVTKQMTILITLHQVELAIESITVATPLTEPNTTLSYWLVHLSREQALAVTGSFLCSSLRHFDKHVHSGHITAKILGMEL